MLRNKQQFTIRVNIDFNLFGIVKHNNRNMIGHFEGNITKLN